jgi:hypothetical protein
VSGLTLVRATADRRQDRRALGIPREGSSRGPVEGAFAIDEQLGARHLLVAVDHTSQVPERDELVREPERVDDGEKAERVPCDGRQLGEALGRGGLYTSRRFVTWSLVSDRLRSEQNISLPTG